MLKNRLSLVFVLLGLCFTHEAASLNVGYRRIEIQDAVIGERFASGGYVVAARMHPRDNFQDMSGVGSVSVWTGRPKQISRVIDRVLEDKALGPHIQRQRIGVVGHSSGGYTALAVAGAKPSMNALVQHCREIPEDARFCSFGGAAVEKPAKKVAIFQMSMIVAFARSYYWHRTVLFTDEALSNLVVPVRIYGAERDDLTPVQYHAERLAKALAAKTEYVLIKGAGHFSFIAGFPDALRNSAGEAGQDPNGFDRNPCTRL